MRYADSISLCLLQSGNGHVAQNFSKLCAASALAASISLPICKTFSGRANKRSSGLRSLLRHHAASWPSLIAANIPRNTTSRARTASMRHPQFISAAHPLPAKNFLAESNDEAVTGVAQETNFAANFNDPLALNYERTPTPTLVHP